jgi:dTDP-4-dehydrorhamnose 3,5-epimerase
MRYQHEPHAEAKLVRCTRGRVLDVAVDLRPGSPTYRRWVADELTADGGEMLFIPPGCAHGYLTLEPETDLLYQTSVAYHPESATGIRWDDPLLAIDWGRQEVTRISDQDRAWPLLEAGPDR